MKKGLKITLAIVISVLMVVTCGITVWAATADETNANNGMVARIGAEGTGTYYATLEEAFSNASNGDTITVIADTTTTESITVTNKLTLTSENGSKVTLKSAMGALNVKGDNADLTITGNIKIASSSSEPIYLDRGRLEVAENAAITGAFHTLCIYTTDSSPKAELVISGGTVTATHTKDEVKSTIGNYTKGAKITMTGGNVVSNCPGAILNTMPNTIIEITGGTVTAPKNTIVFKDSASGTLSIGGTATVETLTGNQAIYLTKVSGATTVNISDNATISCGGSWAIETASSITSDLTFNMSGGKLEVPNGKGGFTLCSKGKTTLNISGGTLTCRQAVHLEGTGTYIVNVSDNAKFEGAAEKAIYNCNATNAEINVKGGTVSAAKHSIFFDESSGGKINVTGGTIKTTSGSGAIYFNNKTNAVTLNMTSGTIASAADDGIYKGKAGSVNATISGGTISAKNYTVDIAEGTNTFDISGGTIIATGDHAIAKWGDASANITFNISNDAKIYAAKQAIEARGGMTVNISGGLIDVGNTYTIESEANSSAIVTFTGIVNITGGKFVLGGNAEGAQMIYHASDNHDGQSNVDGGLFVDLNTENKVLFGTNVNFVSGRAIYGENVIRIINGGQSASKNLQVYYGEGDDLYYYFTKFAATDADKNIAMEDGASIRLTEGSSGIRFTTTFAEVEGATYGTIILPARYVVNLSSFTLEELVAKNIPHNNVVATNGIEVVDGVVTIKAAITNILPKNYGTAFAAIAYMEIDGVYYYSEFNMYDNARSIDAVAKAALNDTQEEKTEKYAYAFEAAEGVTMYSPYTATQRTALEGFIVATFNLTRPEGSTLMNVGSGAYELYSANVTEAAYNNYKAGIENAGFTKAL